MPSIIKRSMAGGEIAPALYARADQVKYQTGLRTCRNFGVLRHGGVANRAGTKYITTTKTLGKRVNLLRFVFNADQTYVLEFGDQYIRFIRNGGVITVSGLSTWLAGTTYAEADLVVHLGINYYSKQDGNIGNTPASSPAFWHPLVNDIYEIPTPYLEADLQTLDYTQSADVVTITHPSYDITELQRTGHTAWKLVTVSIAPSIAAPTAPILTPTAGGTGTYEYVITAVKAETYEESVASAAVSTATGSTPTEQAAHALSWTGSTGAQQYNIYKSYDIGATHGFIGSSDTLVFRDTGILPDFTKTPPVTRDPFSGADNKPAIVNYIQQRRVFGRSNNQPQTNWLSKSADHDNFTISYPLQEDDAVTFTLTGSGANEVNEIRHLLGVDARFIVLTAGGEWVIRGDIDGVVTPSQQNPVQVGYNGASRVRPVIVGNTALFIQSRGNIVRDMRYEVTSDGNSQSGYRGRDISVFADHLFKGKTITQWAYQQVPDSTVWSIRSDGQMLGLTYLREHEIWGWHRHDTDGAFENVVAIPEGAEDFVYAVVKRTIGGTDYRYIERMESRFVTDIAIDAFFVDSGLSYDGRNTSATTMTLTTGAGWTPDDTITATASAGYFVAGDVGNEVVMRAGTDKVRVSITGYTSPTVVTGSPNKDVPVSLQGVAVTDWGKAVDQFSGFDHLEGKTVSILGDGSNDPQKVVTAGAFTSSRPFEVLHAGLPIEADIETLDLEVLDGETLSDKKLRVNGVTLLTQGTRGFFVGDSATNLVERKVDVAQYANPSQADPEKTEILPRATWNNHGRVFIRQSDPLPITILGIVPSGIVGG